MIYLFTYQYRDFDMHFYFYDDEYYILEDVHKPKMTRLYKYFYQENDWRYYLDAITIPPIPHIWNIKPRSDKAYIDVCELETEKIIFIKL